MRIILASGLLALANCGVAAAVSVTGTWAGTIKCKQVAGEAKTVTVYEDATLEVSEDGTNLNAAVSAAGLPTINFDGERHDASKPGSGTASLVRCDNDGKADIGTDEVVSLKVKADSEKGALSGKSTLQGSAGPGVCKYKFSRTSAVDPLLSGSCPLNLGASCTDGSQCASGNCADGVCCDTACDTACLACANSLTGEAGGSCLPINTFGASDTSPEFLCGSQSGGGGDSSSFSLIGVGCAEGACGCDGSGSCKQGNSTYCLASDVCLSGYCDPGTNLCSIP